MLAWSLVLVLVLLAGAAVLAVLATRLEHEVRLLATAVAAIAALAGRSHELDDEIVLTRARRVRRRPGPPGGASLSAPAGR